MVFPLSINEKITGAFKEKKVKILTYRVLENGITILASVVHIISIICKMASTIVRNLDSRALACAL